MTKKLVFFNHKGGVGKTTLTVNIAAALSEAHKRVLLVDADPQCNLSSYLLQSDVLDDYLDSSDSAEGRTLWSSVQPVAEGVGDVKIVRPVELSGGQTLLIPGDIRMSEFEGELSEYWTQCIQRKAKGYRGTTAISSLVQQISNDDEVDIVLYDIGPNIGPLNRVILLDCDALVIPVACDIFSLRALKTVGRVLLQWIKEWETICTIAPSSLDLMAGRPRLLGYIPQQFRTYRGVPARNYARILTQIDKQVRSDVVSVLSSYDKRLIGTAGGSNIGQVKDYGSLIPAAQQAGTALWLTQGATQDQRQEARAAFRSIANNILRRL